MLGEVRQVNCHSMRAAVCLPAGRCEEGADGREGSGEKTVPGGQFKETIIRVLWVQQENGIRWLN